MRDEQISRNNFYIMKGDDGSLCVMGHCLPGLVGGVLTRIPAEVAPDKEAAETMLPWIADGLRRAYETGRAGGIAAHQTMFRELIGAASEKEVKDLRDVVSDKADRD